MQNITSIKVKLMLANPQITSHQDNEEDSHRTKITFRSMRKELFICTEHLLRDEPSWEFFPLIMPCIAWNALKTSKYIRQHLNFTFGWILRNQQKKDDFAAWLAATQQLATPYLDQYMDQFYVLHLSLQAPTSPTLDPHFSIFHNFCLCTPIYLKYPIQ